MDLSLCHYLIPVSLLDPEMKSWLISHARSYWLYQGDLLVAMTQLPSLIFRIKYSQCLITA